MTDEACRRWELLCVEIYLLDNRPTLTLYHFSDIVGTFPSAKAKTVLGYIHALFTSNHYLMSSWFGVSVTAVL